MDEGVKSFKMIWNLKDSKLINKKGQKTIQGERQKVESIYILCYISKNTANYSKTFVADYLHKQSFVVNNIDYKQILNFKN